MSKQSFRGGSRTATTSKMERFVIIVNGFEPLTIITKRSILDVAAVLDPPLVFATFTHPYTIRATLTLSNIMSEEATRGVLLKKVFLRISQNSQENTCARVSFLIKLQT